MPRYVEGRLALRGSPQKPTQPRPQAGLDVDGWLDDI